MSGKGESFWRIVSLAGLACGAAALSLVLVLWQRLPAAVPERQASGPRAPSAATAPAIQLAGRSATLSRILADRRVVARIQLDFGANGALAVACEAEAADGAQTPCFERAKGTGTWSLAGARLCLAAAALNLAPESCYDLSGEAPNLRLSGAGLLGGNMQLR